MTESLSVEGIVSKQSEKPQKPQNHSSRSGLGKAGPQQKVLEVLCGDMYPPMKFFETC